MPPNSKRYCASPEVLALLARDGIGWGHDLTKGCFETEVLPKRTFFQRLKGDRR